MEAFFDICPCKKIGITGSDGKTTTTSIIAQLLKNEGLQVHVGGNIGNPLLCSADDIEKDDIVVLELSSFQLISMKKCPEIAVVTNLSPNHLDVHKDMAEYKEAKRNIFLRQNPNDTAVFNLDNQYTEDYASFATGSIRYFSRLSKTDKGFYCEGENIYSCFDGVVSKIMKISDIKLPGVHNIENFLAAFTAVYGLVSKETMIKTAHSFSGVAHRLEFVRELDGIRFYNDSIASGPTRTIAGLRSFDQKVILIAGGKDKNIPFDELGEQIVKHVKTLVLTGLTADKIKKAVEDAPNYKGAPDIIIQEDFTDAVITAAQIAKSGDIVILYPDCTSFDRFKNFEERGNMFKEIVSRLEK
jgi:UDP-N-acetylmuramoylalanine--D-glutamate ligase